LVDVVRKLGDHAGSGPHSLSGNDDRYVATVAAASVVDERSEVLVGDAVGTALVLVPAEDEALGSLEASSAHGIPLWSA